jgi:two-component system LytT family response regulator
VRAFEADAVDYLLTPFDEERFRDAFARATRRIELERTGGLSARLEAVLRRLEHSPASPAPSPDRIAVTKGERIVFVEPGAIEWIEAAGNYVRLHATHESHLLRQSLETMAGRLAPRFVRVRRSALVNRDAIESIEPYAKGSFLLRLKSGATVRTSRHYRAALGSILD